MDLPGATDAVRERLAGVRDIGATITFDFGPEGGIYIDARSVPASVSNEPGPAECRISMKFSDFQAMADGALNPGVALMTGRIRVTGSMAAAMKIGRVLIPA